MWEPIQVSETMISLTWINLLMIIIKIISLRSDSSKDFQLQTVYYMYDYVCKVPFSVILETAFSAFIKTRKNYAYSCVYLSIISSLHSLK